MQINAPDQLKAFLDRLLDYMQRKIFWATRNIIFQILRQLFLMQGVEFFDTSVYFYCNESIIKMNDE